jgi:sulfite dehydrogenase (quinone) subunit SoeA
MAAAGIYTIGGAFWEFGQPDWDRAHLFLLFGVAEDHDSNPIKIGIGKLKARGARIIGVNPIRTGYNAVADDWYGITPGTDGLLILSLVHCLLKAGKIDADYLARWTNAPCLVDADPDSARTWPHPEGRSGQAPRPRPRDGQARPLRHPRRPPRPDRHLAARGRHHRPVFHHLLDRYLADDYAPEAVAERTGLPAARIRALAAEIAHAAFDRSFTIDQPWTDFRGETHAGFTARPVAIHAMRGISAHSNGFQTARALHLLQSLIGAVDAPGAFRFKPPYPKPPPPTRARTSAPGRASRSTARRSASPSAPTTSRSRTTAPPPASTRRSAGRTRCRSTG